MYLLLGEHIVRHPLLKHTDLRYHHPEPLLSPIQHIKVCQVFHIVWLFCFLHIELFLFL